MAYIVMAHRKAFGGYPDGLDDEGNEEDDCWFEDSDMLVRVCPGDQARGSDRSGAREGQNLSAPSIEPSIEPPIEPSFEEQNSSAEGFAAVLGHPTDGLS